MQSTFIDISGKKFHYKSELTTESNKPVCIFIHGANPESQNTEFWLPLVPIIIDLCQPIFLDGYGHGQSAKPSQDENLGIEDILQIYSKFIKAILEKEQIEQFYLVGRSLGGLVTHTLAQLFGSSLAGIGLIAPARAGKTSETLQSFTKNVSVLWDSKDPMVGFQSYKTIEETVKQVKLFVIGADSSVKCFKNVLRKNGTNPSHVPELQYQEVFKEFLKSIIDN